jgi:hypothetical protein
MWGLRYGRIFSLVSHSRVATKRSILHGPLATGFVLALSSVFAVQTVGAVSEGSLHPSWSDSAMAEGWRAVCGDVRNVGQVPARSVEIRGSAAPAKWSARGITTSSQTCQREAVRSSVCQCPPGRLRYNVTVLRADWGFVEAP